MEKIKELFIPKELAILAVQKGFKELVIGFFDMETNNLFPSIQTVSTLIHGLGQSKEDYKDYEEDDEVFIDYNGYCYNETIQQTEYPAITYDQITKWFREKNELFIEIARIGVGNNKYHFCWGISNIKQPPSKKITVSGVDSPDTYSNYYEALNKAIEEAFKLIKK